jgi:putative MFS transporter
MSASLLAARLDRLPFGRFHRRVLCALAFAFAFEFGDLNTFAYVAPALREQLHFTLGNIAFVTSASFLGMFLGAAGGGRVADLLGRRRALLLAITVFSLSSLANATASSVPGMAAARVATGIGLSAMTVAATTYISETMPAARRGRMQSAVMAIGLLGIPAMSFTATGVVPLGTGTWRWVFVLGALGLVGLPLILRLPESPRWLAGRGRTAEADTVISAIEQEIRAQGKELPEPEATVPASSRPARSGYRSLLTGRIGRRTLMLCGVWIFQTLGFYGFVAWVPTLLATHGFSITHSLTFSALTTIGAAPGALLAWPLSDRFGRKAPIAIVALGIAGCGLAYGLTFNAVAIVVFGFCVNALIQTFAALLYAYTPELFPTEYRNSGNGLVYGVGRLSNIAGPLIVAALFGSMGYRAVFAYIAACWVLVAGIVAVFGARTGMRHLEQLSSEDSVSASAHGHPVGAGAPFPESVS